MTSMAHTVAKIVAKLLSAFALGMWTGTELVIRATVRGGISAYSPPEWFGYAAEMNFVAIMAFLAGVVAWVVLDVLEHGVADEFGAVDD